jgi:hypothetical protein
MAFSTQFLVYLENAPHVILMILLVLRVDSVQFTGGTGRSEQWGMKEAGETRKCAGECRC